MLSCRRRKKCGFTQLRRSPPKGYIHTSAITLTAVPPPQSHTPTKEKERERVQQKEERNIKDQGITVSGSVPEAAPSRGVWAHCCSSHLAGNNSSLERFVVRGKAVCLYACAPCYRASIPLPCEIFADAEITAGGFRVLGDRVCGLKRETLPPCCTGSQALSFLENSRNREKPCAKRPTQSSFERRPLLRVCARLPWIANCSIFVRGPMLCGMCAVDF